jgi:hypothetical protein
MLHHHLPLPFLSPWSFYLPPNMAAVHGPALSRSNMEHCRRLTRWSGKCVSTSNGNSTLKAT